MNIKEIIGDLKLMQQFASDNNVDFYDDSEKGEIWCLHCGDKFRYNPAEWKHYKPHVRFLLIEFDRWRAKHKCSKK